MGPVVQHRQVPVEKRVEVPVPVLQTQYQDVQVPVPQYRQVPREVPVPVQVPVQVPRHVPVPRYVDVPVDVPHEVSIPRQVQVPVPVTKQVYVDVPHPADQPFEQLVHSVRDVHVPHPVPTMAAPMPTTTLGMSTPFVGGNMFGAMSLGTTGFGTF